MSKTRLTVALVLAWLWALPWTAHAGVLPHPALVWEEFPAREWSLDILDPATVYPDWQPASCKFESYYEAERSLGTGYGLATCQVFDPLLIAAVYYSPDGQVYLTQPPLPLAAGQRITLTWQLPAQDEGVSRLMLLSTGLLQADWEAMLVSPTKQDAQWPGLVAEQWLGRRRKQLPQLPWVQASRALSQPPAGFENQNWPDYRAWLQTDLALATKDCWVETDAFPVYSIDEFGSSGRWALDWSSEFTLYCRVDYDSIYHAALILTGKPKADFIGASQPELELEVNGWSLSNLAEAATVNGMQQYVAEVGQYLQQGENQLAVRLDAVSGGILHLESIELWVR